MKVLINFSTLKIGGGQNVALNFLYHFHEHGIEHDLYFFVAEGSECMKFLEKNGYDNFHCLPSNPVKRIFFELFNSKKLLDKIKPDLIYSYFGFGLFSREYKQVVGSADSNLFFPEVDFWADYKGIGRLKKDLIDSYRIYGLKRADAVVFENESLERNAKQLYKIKLTTTIKPSINIINSEQSKPINTIGSTNKKIGLFLCGWHFNKNILIIPQLAANFRAQGIEIRFILTADPKSSSIEKQIFEEQVEKYNVRDMISVIGPIGKAELSELYSKVDFVFLLSRLESFSNNIIEAWSYRKLLVITDALWSRAICGSAALFVDRDSVKDISDKIIALTKSDEESIISAGVSSLAEYPVINKRIKEEMSFLKKCI